MRRKATETAGDASVRDETLYVLNTPDWFWQPRPPVSAQVWQSAAEAAADSLPNGGSVLAQHGWAGLMWYILGEGQFGASRYRLSPTFRMYYLIKPWLSRRARTIGRVGYHRLRQPPGILNWPIEDRYVRFLYRMRDEVSLLARSTIENDVVPGISFGEFWPNDARYSFVITHDVEESDGQAFVGKLAETDNRYGFRSAFNFVAEDYSIDLSLLRELRQSGFEVGIHGLKHNGKLFSSQRAFYTSATRINKYLLEWGAVGFRAPLTHRNPKLLQALDVDYDSSFFDTDPYEAMPGGTMSIWPFFCGRFVELPYTLMQDHTLLVVLGARTPRLWIEKLDFIEQWGGMALVNVHPDYMRNPDYLAVYEEFLQEVAHRTRSVRMDRPSARVPSCWHALPSEVARWWRQRNDQLPPTTPSWRSEAHSEVSQRGGVS